jgi:hypothetical protein
MNGESKQKGLKTVPLDQLRNDWQCQVRALCNELDHKKQRRYET